MWKKIMVLATACMLLFGCAEQPKPEQKFETVSEEQLRGIRWSPEFAACQPWEACWSEFSATVKNFIAENPNNLYGHEMWLLMVSDLPPKQQHQILLLDYYGPARVIRTSSWDHPANEVSNDDVSAVLHRFYLAAVAVPGDVEKLMFLGEVLRHKPDHPQANLLAYKILAKPEYAVEEYLKDHGDAWHQPSVYVKRFWDSCESTDSQCLYDLLQAGYASGFVGEFWQNNWQEIRAHVDVALVPKKSQLVLLQYKWGMIRTMAREEVAREIIAGDMRYLDRTHALRPAPFAVLNTFVDGYRLVGNEAGVRWAEDAILSLHRCAGAASYSNRPAEILFRRWLLEVGAEQGWVSGLGAKHLRALVPQMLAWAEECPSYLEDGRFQGRLMEAIHQLEPIAPLLWETVVQIHDLVMPVYEQAYSDQWGWTPHFQNFYNPDVVFSRIFTVRGRRLEDALRYAKRNLERHRNWRKYYPPGQGYMLNSNEEAQQASRENDAWREVMWGTDILRAQAALRESGSYVASSDVTAITAIEVALRDLSETHQRYRDEFKIAKQAVRGKVKLPRLRSDVYRLPEPSVEKVSPPVEFPQPASGELVARDGSDYRLSGVQLIGFWYPTCPPCRKEVPALEKVAEHLNGAEVALVNIQPSQSVQSVPSFFGEVGLSYQDTNIVLLEGSRWHQRLINAGFVPYSVPWLGVFVDGNLVINLDRYFLLDDEEVWVKDILGFVREVQEQN